MDGAGECSAHLRTGEQACFCACVRACVPLFSLYPYKNGRLWINDRKRSAYLWATKGHKGQFVHQGLKTTEIGRGQVGSQGRACYGAEAHGAGSNGAGAAKAGGTESQRSRRVHLIRIGMRGTVLVQSGTLVGMTP